MRLVILTLLLISGQASAQLRSWVDINGTTHFTNISAECFEIDENTSQDIVDRCTTQTNPSYDAPPKVEAKKSSDIQITERKLERLISERTSIESQKDGLSNQLKINPDDIAAKKSLSFYNKRISDKNREILALKQRLFFMKLASSFRGEKQ